jgi:hypothetical protein
LSGERRIEHIITQDGDAVIAISPPRSFEVVYPRFEAHWVTNLRILRDRTLGTEGLILPNLSQFWGILTPQQRGTLRPRIETDKFSFQVTPRTERIRLQIPTNWDILKHVFKASFSNVGFSDQGRYMNRVLELFGGLTELHILLSDPRITYILDEFLKHHRTGQIPEDKSYRRALSLNHMYGVVSVRMGSLSRKKRDDNVAFINQTIEELIKNGAIHSGYVLDCSHCGLEEWYPIDEVTETYRCRRCLSTQPRPLSPLVHFRLNEALYQAYASNFLVPIQTLKVLMQSSRASFIFCPQIKLDVADVHSPELDIVAIQDGEITIGEATSKNKIQKTRVYNIGEIAQKIQARRVIFSTTNRKNCNNTNCDSCISERNYADNAFSQGSESRGEWGTREFIRDLRTRLVQHDIQVACICAEDIEKDSFHRRRPV